VLLVTLCTSWVIGISLVGYLTLVANQHRSTHHSQAWAACIPVLEAGIEEALTQLNYNGEGVSNAVAHGWISANGVYFKSRTVGTDGSYVETTINTNAASSPVITAKGYAAAPKNTGVPMGNQNSPFGMILGVLGQQSSAALVGRTVVVATSLQAGRGGPGGIRAKGKVTFIGGGSLDSFDSSDANYSNNGQYDPAKRKANGIVLSNSSAADAIHVDDAYIYGMLTTGAGGGTVTIDAGAVGDTDWNTSGVTGQSGLNRIQTGHQTGDANVQFDDVVVPFSFGSGSTPIMGTVAGTNYTYVVNGAVNSRWNIDNVNLSSGKSLIITGGDVTLYCNGNFTTSSSGYVYVAPGASLKLYVGGSLIVSGTGINNGAGNASKLSVYGLSTSAQTWAYSGSSAFIGMVYAPYANFSFSGTAGAMGSFSANTVNISGGASLHYDEHLGGGSSSEYVAVAWNEM